MTPEYLEKIRYHLTWSNPSDLSHKITLRYAQHLKAEVDRLNAIIATHDHA